jgi:hypothetical protein
LLLLLAAVAQVVARATQVVEVVQQHLEQQAHQVVTAEADQAENQEPRAAQVLQLVGKVDMRAVLRTMQAVAVVVQTVVMVVATLKKMTEQADPQAALAVSA